MGLTQDILIKSSGIPIDKIIVMLNTLAAAAPEYATEVASIIGKLNIARTLENVARVAVLIPAEVGNIIQGQIDPRDHPSDAA